MVIVSYRTPELTERAVRSALTSAVVGSVVIVDNHSGDATLARIRSIEDERVLIVENDTNAGFGSAANRGAAQATGDVLLFLNSDAQLRSDSAERLAAAVSAEDGRAIVGPKLIDAAGRTQRSAGLLPRPPDLAFRALGLHLVVRLAMRLPLVGRLLARSRIAVDYDSALTATRPIGTSMISGACFAIGRGAFLELGCFDPVYFMYFEDADLARRATRAGMAIRYHPETVVEHVGGASSRGDYHFGTMHGPSMVVYLGRWYGRAGALLAIGLLLLRATGKSIARIGGGEARDALRLGVRAYRDGRSSRPSPRSVPRP